jgi:choline dehydrogenase
MKSSSADDTLRGETFDYVIVGAGTAGSVLADRLSESGRSTLCVIEAGPPDTNRYLHIPAGFTKTLYDPAVTWQFKFAPSEGTAGRQIALPQGRVFGGSSSINGLVYNRGQAADYDAWAKLGNPGWSYEEVLPYFRRSERRIGGDDRYRGREGGLDISDNDWIDPLAETFIAGVVASGIPRNVDYNGATQEGVGYFQRMIHKGKRVSAARAFLRPAMARKNVEVRPNAQVRAILLDGKRAIGVRYTTGPDGGQREVLARREVLISAGTINTTKLMQLSGIGPPQLLQDLGIPVRHELPGVGENFRDHYFVRLVSRIKNIVSLNQRAHGPRLVIEMAKWAMGRPSILALSPSLVHVFWKSSDELTAPDLQFVFTPGSYRPGSVYVLDEFPAITCGFTQERPESVGYVRIKSPDPDAAPEIQPNYLQASKDRQVVIRAMRMARAFMQTPQLAPYYDGEELPGAEVTSDEGLLDYARKTGNTGYHVIGTCGMGPASNPMAVVDPELRVHGLTGLRVVDASVMPLMVSANTFAATSMVAEKAADMIKKSASLAH